MKGLAGYVRNGSRIAGALACLLALVGCGTGTPGPGGGGDAAKNRVAGRLIFDTQAPRRTVIEAEPNNWFDGSQFVGYPAAGQRYAVIGLIDAAPPDNDVDTYRFTTTEPLTVTWRVTSADPDAGTRFDLYAGVINFVDFNCQFVESVPPLFAECVTDMLSEGRAGTYVVDGTFEIAVLPNRGRGSYVLDVAFEQPELAAAVLDGRAPRPGHIGSPAPRPGPGRSCEPPTDTVVPGEVLASFDPALTLDQVERIASERGLRVLDRSPSGVYRLGDTAPPDRDTARARMRLEKTVADFRAVPGVRVAEPNRLLHASAVPNDQHYALLGYPDIINLPDAWDVTTGDRDVIVAVIDTGVLYEHPDLGGRLMGGYDFVSNESRSLDGDGRDDDPSDPGDAAGDDEASTFHGTHTAGTIAAMSDNTIGVAGITWSCRLMPIRALGIGSSGEVFELAEAIRYAAGLDNVSGRLPPRRADVMNLSFDGGAGWVPSEILHEAVQAAHAAGVIMVAAAGNTGSTAAAFPAGYPEVISVGAVDWDLTLAEYSNHGPTLDLVAVGGARGTFPDGTSRGVLSTVGADTDGPITFEYGYRYGTSMACPQVAGVVALMLSANSALSAAQVRDILHGTATDLGLPGRDDDFGYGLVNAAAAVEQAGQTEGESTPPPSLSLSTQVLDFGEEATALSVSVRNRGGGVLPVDQVTVRELVGSEWLAVTSGGGNASSTVTSIGATVDRDGLSPGRYRGVIEVSAAGAAPMLVHVFAAVAGSSGPPDRIDVIALHPETGALVGRAMAGGDGTYEFDVELDEVGPVWLVAGTDRDGDGRICEPGDLCGAWPSVLEPIAVNPADEPAPIIELTVYEAPLSSGWPALLSAE